MSEKTPDPTKDPKFQGVVNHFLKTPPQPRKAKPAKRRKPKQPKPK